ncbi:hypothetical protein [Shewanella dokdonensis]|nr:hypothetical protein [Shewanella dokdonensis]
MSVARATVVFYVADVPKSQAFYTALFGQPPYTLPVNLRCTC